MPSASSRPCARSAAESAWTTSEPDFPQFAYLKHLRADTLKIDGLFIRDLHLDADNQVFVRAIVNVAKGLGKTVVAEYVENEKTLKMLEEFGVNLVQGYFLDLPSDVFPPSAAR